MRTARNLQSNSFSLFGTAIHSRSILLGCAIIQIVLLFAGERAFGFGPGDRLKAISPANIRSGPGTGYQVVDTASTGDLGVIISGPYYDGIYYWYSNHWDTHLSGYSASINLNAIPPATPSLVSPGSTSSPGTIYTDSLLYWSWSASIGATNYGQYVRDVTTGSMVVSNDYIGNGTYFQGSLPFVPGHSYKWNMTASDSAGFSGASGLLYFQYIPPPTNIQISYFGITATSAVFSASLYPNGTPVTVNFQYGTTTAYGNATDPSSINTNLNAQWLVSSTNNTLSANTLYHLRLTAANSGGTYYSGDASFTTLNQPPAAPSNLTVSNVINGISLNWRDNSSNESGFLIQRRQNSSYSYFSVSANQTNFTDTSTSSGLQYCYSVSATNSGGSSAYTAEQCATYTLPGPTPYSIIIGNTTPVPGTAYFYGGASIGTNLQYGWDSSDGQHYTAATAPFQFNAYGSYWIRLVVTDPFSRSSTSSVPVNVQPINNGRTTLTVAGADPVVLSTGNYIQTHTDLQIPGKGFPFAFFRFYNSKYCDQSGRPLGFGWTFSYNQQLSNTGSNVLVSLGDGSTWTFFPTNGVYVAEPGFYDSLTTNSDGSWLLTDKAQTVSKFNTNGSLASITDKNGNSLTCFYTNYILGAIQDTAGRQITFTTNSYSCIASMTDPIGRTIQFQYDANTNLVAVIDARGNTSRYAYDSGHRMTDATNALGIRYIHNEYDQTNFTVIRQCDAYNNWTRFAYDFTNRITIQTNVLGKISIHSFDNNLLETNEIDETGHPQVFAYDGNRNRTYIKDKNGNETRYLYDALGNVTNKTDALNNVTTIQFDSFNNPVRCIDALTNTAAFGYDSRGNLTSTTNALGLVSRMQYDGCGLPIILTDARGFSTTNQYDSCGNLTNLIDAKGFSFRFEFDGVGRKVRQIDPLNHATSFGYDNNGNLLFVTNALGFVNAYTYDANNNHFTSTDPRNAITTNVFDLKDRLVAVLATLNQTNGMIYDALDRKVASYDALGNKTSYGYDDIGNLIAVTNAFNQTTRFTFDPNSNQTSAIDATGHYVTNFFDPLNHKVVTVDPSISTNSTTYDALGRVISATNANGQVTRFFYDGIGRLTNVIDSANQSVFFAYDENGNRIRLTDPNGHTWTNKFDELNRIFEQDDPLGNKTIFRYDSVGNLTNKITPNSDSIVYSYDAINRLTNIAYPDSTSVAFAYDEVGNRTNMIDSAGSTTWRYDLLNRLTTVTDPFGQTISERFDANGNRVSLTYPGNKTVSYGFDALNRMAALTNWLNGGVTYNYDNRGNLIASTNANGTTVSYSYDVANRVVALTNAAPDGNVIAAYAVSLDGVGNRTQATHNQPLFPILANQTNNYSYDSDNRLFSVDGQTVSHNQNGDLTGIGTNTYAYDFEDRLLSVTNGSTISAFTYDGLGNRLVRTINGQERRFVLDRMGALTQILIETDTNNLSVAYYIYGLGLAERISASGTVSTYHCNIQGNTTALTDSGGNVTDSYAYDSFGVLANTDGGSPQPFRYLGRHGIVDDGTGLLYARARYWSPQLGRFFTKDPVTATDDRGQSLDQYIYALNNPLRFVDPNGLTAQEWRNVPANPNDAVVRSFWGDVAFDAVLSLGFGSVESIGKSVIERLALNTTKGVPQVILNKIAGEAAERTVATALQKEGYTILGSKVGVRTSEGLRYLDHLVQSPEGDIFAVEVKFGSAIRTVEQEMKDVALKIEGGVFTGSGGLSQQLVNELSTQPIPTILINVR